MASNEDRALAPSDLDDRTAAEESHRARLTRVLAASKEGWWERDLVSGKVYRSPRWYEMFGYKEGEISEKDKPFLLMHPDDVKVAENRLAEAIAEGRDAVEAEYRYATRAGNFRSVLTRVRVTRNGAGEPVLLSGSAMDITERQRAEEKLRQAQKIETMGQITAGIAHEFNNLLAIVMGNLELAQEALDSPDQARHFLTRAFDATRRGGQLTDHLLAFGRRQLLSPQHIDLCIQVPEMVALLKHTFSESVTVEAIVPTEPIIVQADIAHLDAALLNLAFNARDAMKHGGVLCFTVAFMQLEEPLSVDTETFVPGRYSVITVQDTGAGMASEVLARAFDPFFTTKGFGTHAGLGLSMVYGFMRQSNGFVQLASSKGEGATVRLWFPVVDARTQ